MCNSCTPSATLPTDVTILCTNCRAEVAPEDTTDLDGSPYCQECAEYCTEPCGRCGTVVLTDELESCRDNDRSRNSRMLCESCRDDYAFECAQCGDLIEGEGTTVGGDYEQVCDRCLENYYSYCEDCEEYHHCDDTDGNGGNRMDPHEDPILGEPTPRFGLRTVGIEIETGRGAAGGRFGDPFARQFPHWGNKYDDSLSCGGRELVSPPMGGDAIEEVAGVYQFLNNKGVDMQDDQAGCHIHVDYQDVNKLVNEEFNAGREDTPRVDAMVMWGNTMTDAVRLMVERGRAQNIYCNNPFGARGSGEGGFGDSRFGYHDRKLNPKIMPTGYSTIAVREQTLEFRIWSVTDDSNLALARLEFSQKSVDYLAQMVAAPSSKRKVLKDKLIFAAAAVRAGNLTAMARLFRLTKDTVAKLQPFVRKNFEYRIRHECLAA